MQLKVYLATIPKSEMNRHVLLRLLRIRTRGKHWQFGEEVGHTTGYEHYQVRYESSNNDYNLERKFWRDYRLELQEGNGWSDYERKDGNFFCDEDDYLGKYRFGQLRELQNFILSQGHRQSDRTITAIVDHEGGIGKTYLARWMCLNGKADYIDGNGTASRIVSSAYDLSVHHQIRRLFVDITRNTNANRDELWSAIEQIKNGYLKDDRYEHRERWIRPPEVYLFTNHEPKWDKLSTDRWDKVFIHTAKREDGKLHYTVWYKRDGIKRQAEFYQS